MSSHLCICNASSLKKLPGGKSSEKCQPFIPAGSEDRCSGSERRWQIDFAGSWRAGSQFARHGLPTGSRLDIWQEPELDELDVAGNVLAGLGRGKELMDRFNEVMPALPRN